MRINTMRLLILPLALTAAAAMGGCARADGNPPPTEDLPQERTIKPPARGAVPYNSPMLRISYDRLSLLDDGTVLVFITYMNLSDEMAFEILLDDASTSSGHLSGSRQILLSESGSGYRLVGAGQLQAPAGLRLFPNSSVKAGFVFRREGLRSRWLPPCNRRADSPGFFHLISSQRVREVSAEGSGERGREWGVSLVFNHMAP